MISTRPLAAVSSPFSKRSSSGGGDDTPTKRVKPVPVRVLFSSPSPPKSMPAGVRGQHGGGGVASRSLSFGSAWDSPSKPNRVTFSPNPSIQKMHSMDTPQKLLKTPTKVPDTPSSEVKSILKSPLMSPPHFNKYFVQQPSPLVGHDSSGVVRKIAPVSTNTPGKASSVRSLFEANVEKKFLGEAEVSLRRSPRRVTSPTVTERSLTTEETESDGTLAEPVKSEDSDVTSLQLSVPCHTFESKAASPLKDTDVDVIHDTPRFVRRRRLSLKNRISPTLARRNVARLAARSSSSESERESDGTSKGFSCHDSASGKGSKTSPNGSSDNEGQKGILQERNQGCDGKRDSQDSEVRSPRRRLSRKRSGVIRRRPSFSCHDESANVFPSENLIVSRGKRRLSPESSGVSDGSHATSKRRKSSADGHNVPVDSSSTDFHSVSEFFAASQEIPQNTSRGFSCDRFARLGSSSNDLETGHGEMLRGRLRWQLSGASDSNSTVSHDPPSSPVFRLTAAPTVVRNKSLDRVLSVGFEPGTTDSESSRPSSPVFGSRYSEQPPVSASTVISPGRSQSEPTDPVELLSVSPASSTRSKTSPGLKRYSPNVSAKGLAELMHSPLQYETNSPSVRKTSEQGRTLRAKTCPEQCAETAAPRSARKSATAATSETPKETQEQQPPRSRRSLYRTETKSAL